MPIPPQAYYPDQKRLRRMSVVQVIFVSGSLWAALSPAARLPLFLRIMVLLCEPYLLVGAFYFVRRALRRTASITLDEQGLHDSATAAAAGLVPWPDIDSVTIYTVQSHRMVGVWLKDNASILSRSRSLRRRHGKQYLGKPAPAFTIPDSTIEISVDEFVEQICDYKRAVERQHRVQCYSAGE